MCGIALNCFMPANAAACFHTSALHPAQYSWPGKHDKGLCLLPGSRFPGVLLPLFQAEQHLRTFFKTSLTIFPCCGIVVKSTTWARSSAGRAFGSHPRGRGFDPLRVHQFAASFCTMRRFLYLKNFGGPCRAPNPEVGYEPGGVINIFFENPSVSRFFLCILQSSAGNRIAFMPPSRKFLQKFPRHRRLIQP